MTSITNVSSTLNSYDSGIIYTTVPHAILTILMKRTDNNSILSTDYNLTVIEYKYYAKEIARIYNQTVINLPEHTLSVRILVTSNYSLKVEHTLSRTIKATASFNAIEHISNHTFSNRKSSKSILTGFEMYFIIEI